MNENLNLVEILKDCPKGTKLYSPLFGEVELDCVKDSDFYPIKVLLKSGLTDSFTLKGLAYTDYDGECMLFPSKDQRDWSKFKPKKLPKFDPNTLQPFDKVLVRNNVVCEWFCHFFSHLRDSNSEYKYAQTDECSYIYCIPYNEDTKHLVGTSDEAPEFYRYWED